jgi:hypothetical protein
MKTIETNRITDTAHAIGEAARNKLGGQIYTPGQEIRRSAVAYDGMVPYPANPNVLLVPTATNMQKLAANPGSVFGYVSGGRVRPAVVTARSTLDTLDITYLAPPGETQETEADFDQINPKNPVVNPTWAMLLKQASAVQDRRVGASHDPNRSMGLEVGHSVLATAALKRPGILRGGHAVHGWTESDSGIAGAVTRRSIGLYDFNLSSGNRQVGEHTATIRSGDTAYLLQIPELDQAIDELAEVSAADLTIGLGLVAVQTQVEASPSQLQDRLLGTIAQL